MKAFPSGRDINKETKHEFPIEFVMDLRDYLASKAMNGILSNPALCDIMGDTGRDYLVSESYKIADEMIKERKNDSF